MVTSLATVALIGGSIRRKKMPMSTRRKGSKSRRASNRSKRPVGRRVTVTRQHARIFPGRFRNGTQSFDVRTFKPMRSEYTVDGDGGQFTSESTARFQRDRLNKSNARHVVRIFTPQSPEFRRTSQRSLDRG